MSEKSLNIAIRARAAVKSAFDEVAKRMQKMRQDADRRPAEFGKSTTEQLAKIFSAAGKIEGAFKLVTAVSKAFHGDLDEADKILRTLPLGIGPLYSAFHGLVGEVGGFNRELERMRGLMKENAKEAKRNQETLAASQGLEGLEAQMEAEMRFLGLDKDEQAIQRTRDMRARRDQEIRKETDVLLQNAINERQADYARERAREAMHRSYVLMVEQQYQLREQFRERDEKEAERAEAERETNEQTRAIDEQQIQEAAIRATANTLQLQLRQRKQMLAAELQAIRESYRQQLVVARSEIEKEQLIRARAIEEEEAVRQSVLARMREGQKKLQSEMMPAGIQPIQVTDRFHGLAAGARSQNSQLDELKRIRAAAEKDAKTQQGILDAMRRLGVEGLVVP